MTEVVYQSSCHESIYVNSLWSIPVVNMPYHSVIHPCAHNLCSVNRKERQARVMATNQGKAEIENQGNLDLDHPMVGALNPEQLARENQALKAKVRTLEAQVIEMMGILQALRSGTTIEAVAIGNPEIITALPPPGPRDQYRALEERLKAVEGISVRAKDACDLCLVPDIVLPPKFKAPNFDKYHGTSCPSSHLTMYCRKMEAFAHNDEVLIHYFQDSLSGASLNWYMQLQPSDIHSWKDLSEAFLKQYQYNMDMAPDRVQLQHMSKKDKESFREYAQRWRGLAAQVKPSLTEKEMVYMFMETLPAPYYERLVGSASSSFSDMVVIGERLENGLRSGKITNGYGGSSGQREFSFNFPKKRKRETNAMMNQGKSYQYDPIPMSYTDLCSYLISHNLISPREMKPVQPPFPKKHNPKASCEFHSGAIGHSAENCYLLKHLVQGLIDTKQLSFTEDGGCQIRNS